MIRLHSVFFISVLAISLAATGCKSELDNKQVAKVSEPVAADNPAANRPTLEPAKAGEIRSLNVDPSTSRVDFVGAKVTRDHTGSFKVSQGKVELRGDVPTRLELVVDLTSVETDDQKLTSHLKTPDFFDIEKYPTSRFVATQFAPLNEGGTHTITGELELHGVKKQLSFPATISVQGASASGKAEFKINRKDFGINYPGMRDDLIKDEVLLKLDLKFRI